MSGNIGANPFSRGLRQLYRPGHLNLQAALADFIDEGYFSRHIRRMREVYAERQYVLRSALKAEFGNSVQLSGSNAGLHLTAIFSNEINTVKMANEAANKGVALRSLSTLLPSAGIA